MGLNHNSFQKRKIGMYSSLLSLLSSIAFAISVLLCILFPDYPIGNTGIYFSNIFITFSFVIIVYSYFLFTLNEDKSSVVFSLVISIINAVKNIIIHHTQFAVTLFSMKNNEKFSLLNFDQFEIFFNLTTFGYMLMSFSFIFIGISLRKINRKEKLLKILMLLHIVFGSVFFLNLIRIILNLTFTHFISIALIIMILSCIYYSIICYLSFNYFKHKNN